MSTTGRPAFAYTPIASSDTKPQKGRAQAAAPCTTTKHNNESTPAAAAVPLRDASQAPHTTNAEAAAAQSTAQFLPWGGRGAFPQQPVSPALLFDIERRDSTFSDLGLVSLNPQSQLQSPEFIYGGGNINGEGTKLALPNNGGGLFDMPWGAAPPRPLSSVGSAATCSPPESTSSGMLSVPIDFASVTESTAPLHHCDGTWSSCSRDPSPRGQSVSVPPQQGGEGESGETAWSGKQEDAGDEYVCLASRCEAKFARGEDLELHARTAHEHVCLWGRDGPCDHPGFATRAELNWHVKREHLLICPVLGCKDSAFPSAEVVDCHLKYVHGGLKEESRQDGGAPPSGFLPALARPASPPTAAPASAIELKKLGKKMGTPDDRILKMNLSIGTSKKRCREQLRAVLVKRAKRANGGNLPALDSSSSLIPKMEASSFPVVWEHGVLPFLVEFMPQWCSPGGLPSHVISVVRGKKPGTRRVSIMTTRALSRARKVLIAWHVRDLLPAAFQSATSFVFSTGEVDRLWARGLGKGMPDEVCEPRNPFCYLSPRMGDSIGVTLFAGEEITATLGPCLTVGEGSYWLANFHPFQEAFHGEGPNIVQHPSPDDRSRCLDERHDALSSVDGGFKLGSLTATSGYDLKTTRVTHDPYWEDYDMEPPLVVTDWTLISANNSQANVLRRFPSSLNPRRESPVTAMSSVVPGALVCSTGRTSGHQRGQVGEIPAYVYGTKAGNGTGRATREWFIEDLDLEGEDDAWIRGGIGVRGDSGAAVVNCETNALVGQVWGRNKFYGPGPRQTFFTPIIDVIDDVQEKCGEQTRPQLPQYREYRDEADRWPVYPVCRRCFDAREYLDSRRSSRASLVSMIGDTGDGGGSRSGREDHDLTSISELATPKDSARTPRDTSHLVRHVGPMDEPPASSLMMSAFSPASLNSAVSPLPVHTFPAPFSIKSPGTGPGDFSRSPYAQAIDEADLYDPKPLTKTDSALGKRPHLGAASLADQDKRRRI